MRIPPAPDPMGTLAGVKAPDPTSVSSLSIEGCFPGGTWIPEYGPLWRSHCFWPHLSCGQGLPLLVSDRRCGEGGVSGYFSKSSRIFLNSSPTETT